MYRHYYNGELAASTEIERARKLAVWEVFEEYADIRDEFEDLLMDFQNMVDEIGTSISDLADGLEDLEAHLDQCDRTFRRFKPRYKQEQEADGKAAAEEINLPFGEEAQAF